MTTQTLKTNIKDLIQQATKVIGARKESDLCRYLPGTDNGHMHHFTFKSLLATQPNELAALIQEYVLSKSEPVKFPPKKRAPHGSRKRFKMGAFSKEDLERLQKVILLSGDTELLKKFSPKPTLKHIKKQLIQTIRNETVDGPLWEAYVDFLKKG